MAKDRQKPLRPVAGPRNVSPSEPAQPDTPEIAFSLRQQLASVRPYLRTVQTALANLPAFPQLANKPVASLPSVSRLTMQPASLEGEQRVKNKADDRLPSLPTMPNPALAAITKPSTPTLQTTTPADAPRITTPALSQSPQPASAKVSTSTSPAAVTTTVIPSMPPRAQAPVAQPPSASQELTLTPPSISRAADTAAPEAKQSSLPSLPTIERPQLSKPPTPQNGEPLLSTGAAPQLAAPTTSEPSVPTAAQTPFSSLPSLPTIERPQLASAPQAMSGKASLSAAPPALISRMPGAIQLPHMPTFRHGVIPSVAAMPSVGTHDTSETSSALGFRHDDGHKELLTAIKELTKAFKTITDKMERTPGPGQGSSPMAQTIRGGIRTNVPPVTKSDTWQRLMGS
jgi:hypothetical protein